MTKEEMLDFVTDKLREQKGDPHVYVNSNQVLAVIELIHHLFHLREEQDDSFIENSIPTPQFRLVSPFGDLMATDKSVESLQELPQQDGNCIQTPEGEHLLIYVDGEWVS